MEDYESKYEEYKRSLLQNRWLIKTLHEKYRGSITAEGDYIDRNGVLWKIGVLGAACGFCVALTFALAESGLWLLGIVLFLAIMGCVILARHIEAKFKRDSGEINFYAFRYNQHFNDHIQGEKDKETYKLVCDMRNHHESIKWRTDSIQNMSEKDIKDLFLYHIKKMDDFQKRYEEISNYDYFAGKLKNDYQFNAEVQKDIDKYI